MPVERTAKHLLRQTTLTGLAAPEPSSSASSKSKTKSKSKSKSKSDRVYTDAVLTIKPEFMELIAKREKNHEYRKYELRDTVERIWLYVIAPVSAITHVITTSRPKKPGEVNDPSGVGNDDFDNGLKLSKFGYPVLGLHKLNPPLGPSDLKARFEIAPPQGYYYATKKLVEEVKLEDMEKLF